MEEKRKEVKQAVPMLVFLSLIFIYTSSTYLRSQYSFFVAVASYALFYVVSISVGQKWRFNNTYLWAGFSVLAIVFYFFAGASDKIALYLSGIIYLTFWVNAFLYLADNYDRKTIKRFAMVNLALLLTNVLTTIRVLEQYPLAARAINGMAEGITEQDVAIYTDMGCGGYGFIYGAVFLTFSLIAVFHAKDTTLKTKIFSILILILTFQMILLAEFATALLLTVILLLFSLVMNSKRLGLNLVFVGIICCFLVIFGDKILNWIHSAAVFMNIDYLAEKMKMLIYASGNDSMDSLSRTQRYMESINGFFSNPLLGSGTSGGHSQIMDTFSTIGIFAFPYVALLFSAFKHIKQYVDKKYVLILAIGILVLATLNPFVDSTVISLTFMMTPTLLYCFVPDKSKENTVSSET